MSSSIPSAVGVPQHADEHPPKDPVLLAVDQVFAEGAGLEASLAYLDVGSVTKRHQGHS